jgi:phosphoribosyl 1,2-cyclic phosphodiesterase
MSTLPAKAEPAGASHSTASAASPLKVMLWGTRGSVPSPGPGTAGFGGNTSCIEVKSAAGPHLVFDCGTGIRLLSQRLVQQGRPVEIELFLTHFHWDHILGFPFLAPLYDSRNSLRIHGPPQEGRGVRELLMAVMGPVYFPLSFQAVRAHLEFFHLEDSLPWQRAGLEVTSMRVQHPGNTHGFRLRHGNASLAYIPDNELGVAEALPGTRWYEELLRFLDGVDLLLHDAMYTDQEYETRGGWGHSTFNQALQLAIDAGVRRLCLFHHAPDRTDEQLVQQRQAIEERAALAGARLEVIVATEGEELMVSEPGAHGGRTST